MAFSRAHYVAIAKLITEATRNDPQVYFTDAYGLNALTGAYFIDKAQLVSDLSDLFRRDNPRFDEGRFIDACYPK